MKKLIILSFVLALMCSCAEKNRTNNANYQPSDYQLPPNVSRLSVVVFDSCEYIQYKVYGGYAITHKGNCKYCAEREIKKP